MSTLPVSKLEAARMALSEVGRDPGLVGETVDGTPTYPEGVLSAVEVWALSNIVHPERPSICLACRTLVPHGTSTADTNAARERCLAWRPFIRDCGLDR